MWPQRHTYDEFAPTRVDAELQPEKDSYKIMLWWASNELREESKSKSKSGRLCMSTD